VEQILINLATNGRDAMADGGVMTIETSNVTFDEADVEQRREIRPGSYVRLAVTDTGAGFDPKIKASLFEPFFTTKAKGKGTGLGLATVYGVVKQSDGYIYASNMPGGGATFEVFLPAVEAPEQTHRSFGTTDEVDQLQQAGHETILLVEDEEPLRAMALSVLEECGYTVLQAADGEEALRVSNQHGGVIDILVTDVVMPKLGGRQVAEQLSKTRRELRVLFMTGYTDDAILRQGIFEGGIEVLQKPFSPNDLARRVRMILDLAGTRQ
jgi:two-component system cell cycle sensor histidine kinase/response regulator CckA